MNKKQSLEASSFLADKTSRPIWSPVSTWLTVLEKAATSIYARLRVFFLFFFLVVFLPILNLVFASSLCFILARILHEYASMDVVNAAWDVSPRKMRFAILWVVRVSVAFYFLILAYVLANIIKEISNFFDDCKYIFTIYIIIFTN